MDLEVATKRFCSSVVDSPSTSAMQALWHSASTVDTVDFGLQVASEPTSEKLTIEFS